MDLYNRIWIDGLCLLVSCSGNREKMDKEETRKNENKKMKRRPQNPVENSTGWFTSAALLFIMENPVVVFLLKGGKNVQRDQH